MNPKTRISLIIAYILLPLLSNGQNNLTELLSKIKIEVENKCKHIYIQYPHSMETTMYENISQVNFNFNGPAISYSYQYSFSPEKHPEHQYEFRYNFNLAACNYVFWLSGKDGKTYKSSTEPFFTVELSTSMADKVPDEAFPQDTNTIVRFQFSDIQTAKKITEYFEQAIALAK